ncbi:MAG: hypothetical protein ACK6AT_19105 [Planctomycetota bacterium]
MSQSFVMQLVGIFAVVASAGISSEIHYGRTMGQWISLEILAYEPTLKHSHRDLSNDWGSKERL